MWLKASLPQTALGVQKGVSKQTVKAYTEFLSDILSHIRPAHKRVFVSITCSMPWAPTNMWSTHISRLNERFGERSNTFRGGWAYEVARHPEHLDITYDRYVFTSSDHILSCCSSSLMSQKSACLHTWWCPWSTFFFISTHLWFGLREETNDDDDTMAVTIDLINAERGR